MSDFNDHHVINNSAVLQDLIDDVLAGSGLSWNIDSRPVNRVYLPADTIAAGQLGASYHQGPHGRSLDTSGYTGAVDQRVRAIIAANANNPEGLVQALDEFALNIRAKLQTRQLSLFGPNDNVTRGRIADDSTVTGGQAELDARARLADAFEGADAPTRRSGLTRLAGYSDQQLVKIAEIFPEFMRKNGLAALAGVVERSPELVGRIVAVFGTRTTELLGTRSGRLLIRALDAAGVAGDLAAFAFVFLDAENLNARAQDLSLPLEERQRLLDESNRTWAGFAADLIGGLAGGAAGLVVGGPFGPALSLALSSGFGIGLRSAVENLYDSNSDFRDFIGGIVRGIRQTVADLIPIAPAQAETIQAQMPVAVLGLMGAANTLDAVGTYTFRDENGQPLLDSNGEYVLRLEYDADANTLRIDRPGTTNDESVANIDLEAAGQELYEQLIEDRLKQAPTPDDRDVENPALIANVDLPDGSHFQRIGFSIGGQSASYRVFRASAPPTSSGDVIVVTPYLYSSDRRTWRDRFNNVRSPGEGWIIETIDYSNPDGSTARVRSATRVERDGDDGAGGEQGSAAPQSFRIPFAQIGSIFGSNLARLIPTEEIWESTLAGALLGTIGQNVGQAIERAEVLRSLPKELREGIDGAFTNLPTEFLENLASAGVGVVSSILVADLVDSLGLDGTLYGDWLQTSWSTHLAALITNLPAIVAGTKTASEVLGSVSPANLLGGFIGTQLAAELVEFNTVGGQIGAAIGSTVGALYGAELLGKIGLTVWGPLGAAIGAFIGYILGGLIGSLVKGGEAKAGAVLGFDASDQRFEVTHTWTKNSGSKDAAKSFAEQVGGLLNGVLDASGSRLIDPGGVQAGYYEMKGDKFWYHAGGLGSSVDFVTKDVERFVNHGSYIALFDLNERLIGGDVFIKRAIAATLLHADGNRNATGGAYAAGDFEVSTLFGNIATARDYASYLENASVINALIAAEPDSAFTASWAISFARVIELGLDKRWASDWRGGWAVFLDETADGKIDGRAFTPGNVFLELDPESNERLFVFVDGDGALLGVIGDTIDTASKDFIEGTSSNDEIIVNIDTIALTTANKLNGETATAGNHKIRVAALIDAGAGNDLVRGGDLGNDILGGDGNDVLIGGKLDDWIFGGAGDDRLYAGNVADHNAAEATLISVDGGNGDYLDGGDGDDQLYGGKGSDWLSGGAGVDRLVGGNGGDILDGGAGNDRGSSGEARLFGGEGSDQYVFYYGSGQDVVYDDGNTGLASFAARNRYLGLNAGTIQRNWAGDGDYQADGSVVGGEDAIAFGPGIGFQDLTLRRSSVSGVAGNDLIIELTHLVNGVRTATGDTLTVKDWFDEARRVEWLRFADGTEIRIGDLSSFIIGTAANDVVIGTDGSDYWLGMDGDDEFYALNGHDFGYGGDGNDLISGDGDNDWILGGAGDDNVMGGDGNDTVFGDAGDDIVSGGAGHDLLSGGRGNDKITGGAGDDIIRYSRGDGHDTIYDDYEATWEVIWEEGEYTNGFVFEDGRLYRGGETLFDNDQWVGGYTYSYGNDGRLYRQTSTIVATTNNGTDTLEFGLDIDIQDVQVRRVGTNLELAIADLSNASSFDGISDRITLEDWFDSQNGASVEHFVFINIGRITSTAWNIGATGTDGDDIVAGTSARDWYTGGLGDDQLSGGDGDDVLVGNHGGDKLLGGAGVDILYGGADDDILDGGLNGSAWGVGDRLYGGAGIDIASYASSTTNVGAFVSLSRSNLNTLWDSVGDYYDSIEGLEGSVRADRLEGDGNDNILRGGAGDDELVGRLGDDAYEYNVGDGHDVVRDGKFDIETIIDESGGIDLNQYTISFSQTGEFELYGVLWWSFQVTLRRKTTNPFYAQGEIVYQSGVEDFIYEAPPNVGGFYPDPYSTGIPPTYPSPDSWPFSNGQWVVGARRIPGSIRTEIEHAKTDDAGDDTLELGAGISLSDITAAWETSNNDLKLTFGVGGSVLLAGQASAGRAVETLILGDGLTADLTRLRLAGQSSTSDGDFFLGGASADTFDGGAGNDVISGGAGDDTLSGGDGDDILEGGAGADVLTGGGDSVSSNLALQPGQSAYGDTIRYVRSASGVTINLAANTATGGDATGDTISGIENVIGSEHADTLTGTSAANRLAGLGGNDVINGGAGDDVLGGGAGDDDLYGGDGDDAIAGDEGADELYGDAGNDILAGGDGADFLAGGAGQDTLDGGAGADNLYGGADDDTLSGGEGDDGLYGEAGADILHGGAGADTLSGGDGDDTLDGDTGNDALQGGVGDDTYVFGPGYGADTITDTQGDHNRVLIKDVGVDRIWFARVGDHLRISIIGDSAQLTIDNFFAPSNASKVHWVSAGGRTIFLNAASGFITAMTAISTSAPATMPTAIASDLNVWWHLGETSAPRVANQNLSVNEDAVLNGSVGATDDDGGTLTYATVQGPAHGSLSLNATTGQWTFTPTADWNGQDGFSIEVDDGDVSVVQHVTVTVNSVNDAPSSLSASGAMSVDENSADGVSVGSFTATDIDHAAGALTYTLVNDAGGRFAISSAGVLTTKTGASGLLNYESATSHTIRVRVTDAAGGTFEQDFVVNIGDVNEAPTNLTFANETTSLSEATSTASRVKVADLVVGDDALGSEDFSLSGADAASFEVDAGVLYLKAGVALNYEAKSSYAVTVSVDDSSVGGTPDASQNFTLTITDANDAPTTLTFTNITAAISEAASTASRIRLADLNVTDDALGSETLGLAGADAAYFEIDAGILYLKSGVSLDFATKPQLIVSITVDDPALGSTHELSETFILTITDGSEPPLSLTFDNAVTSIAEYTSTASRIEVADLTLVDDALGATNVSLTGSDAASFEIDGGALYLKSGVTLDYALRTSYSVIINVDDPLLGSGPELQKTFTLAVLDVNQAPTALTLTNTTTSIAENSSTASRIKMADLSYSDDADGTETYGLTGADASSFEIIGAVLYLMAGVTLNYEAKSSYSVSVTVDDATIGSGPELSENFTLTITDVNEAPTALTFTNTTTTLAENTSTASRIKLADINVADDALGSEALTLTGADAAWFEIDGGALYLKAGVTLNYEAKTSYAVTVSANDPSVGADPDVQQSFTLNVTNVNESPFSAYADRTLAFDENISVGSGLAWFGGSDPDGNASHVELMDNAGGRFTLASNGLLSVGATGLNFEAGASHTIRVRLYDTLGLWTDTNFNVTINDLNEAPNLNEHHYYVNEGTANGLLGTVAATDPDTNSAYRNFRYEIISGDTGYSINATTGQFYLNRELDYEASANHVMNVRVWDGGAIGTGNSYVNQVRVFVQNVNDAPYINYVSYNSWYPDPEYNPWDSPVFWYDLYFGDEDTSGALQYGVSSVYFDGVYNLASGWGVTSQNQYSITYNYYGSYTRSMGVGNGTMYGPGWALNANWESTPPPEHDVRVKITDTNGAWRYQMLHVYGSNMGVVAPIVLDLDGDGIELTNPYDGDVRFNMVGDATAERTGWVNADDGLLVLDRNNDGVINNFEEIAFSSEHPEAVSDLEGLRVYDTNDDGFFDANDAQFSSFRVWRDLNQDGVSQSNELQTLASHDISAINLTLTTTGATQSTEFDNLIYGHASFVRGNGTTGLVGDVMLAYVAAPARVELSGTVLPPIVFDLDGGGLSLVSRHASDVKFDADGNGTRERTGWFGAGEGVLALDRNGDGVIGDGTEISFAQDLVGARTDLEGLRAFDSNKNGFFDFEDDRFGEFRIWQDANQDGVSQAGEVKSLAEWNIQALNLTPTMTGASFVGAQDNVVVATSTFVRTDGSRGQIGDVFLSYDGAPGATHQPSSPVERDPFADAINRLANNQLRRSLTGGGRNWRDDPLRWIFEKGGDDGGDAFDMRPLARNHRARSDAVSSLDVLRRQPVELFDHADPLYKGRDTSNEFQPIAPAPTKSALHSGLGVADRRVLAMVNAMAGFGVESAAEMSRGVRTKDARVSELLTSLPDIRQG